MVVVVERIRCWIVFFFVAAVVGVGYGQKYYVDLNKPFTVRPSQYFSSSGYPKQNGTAPSCSENADGDYWYTYRLSQSNYFPARSVDGEVEFSYLRKLHKYRWVLDETPECVAAAKADAEESEDEDYREYLYSHCSGHCEEDVSESTLASVTFVFFDFSSPAPIVTGCPGRDVNLVSYLPEGVLLNDDPTSVTWAIISPPDGAATVNNQGVLNFGSGTGKTYKIVVKRRFENGESELTLTVNIPPAVVLSAGSDIKYCRSGGEKVLISGEANYPGEWSINSEEGKGSEYLSKEGENWYFAANAEVGSYNLLLTATVNNCIYIAQKVVVVENSVDVKAGEDFEYCQTATSTLLDLSEGVRPGGPGWSPVWRASGGIDGKINQIKNELEIAGIAGGVYTLTYEVTSSTGCKGSDTRQLTIFALPEKLAVGDVTACHQVDLAWESAVVNREAIEEASLFWPDDTPFAYDRIQIQNRGAENIVRTYRITNTDSRNCRSEDDFTITVYPRAVAPPPPTFRRCGAGDFTLDLNTKPGFEPFAVQWYSVDFGGRIIGEQKEIKKEAVADNQKLFVELADGNGCNPLQEERTRRLEVLLVVDPLPLSPGVEDIIICGGGTGRFTAPEEQAGIYKWYENKLDGNPVHTGNFFDTEALIEGRYYYVSFTDQKSCESPRIEISANVQAIPNAPSTTGAFRCGGGEATLGAALNGDDPVYHSIVWYAAANASQEVALTEGSVFRVRVDTASIYYARTVSRAGCRSSAVAAEVEVKPFRPVDIGADIALCTSSATYALTADLQPNISPKNGFFSGTGVSVNDAGKTFFLPEVAAIGEHVITFTLQTQGDRDCYANGTRTITVKEGLGEDLLAKSGIVFCSNDNVIDLTLLANNHPGGSWYPESIEKEGGRIDPRAWSVGQTEVIYSLALENGCTEQQKLLVEARASPQKPVLNVQANNVCTGQVGEIVVNQPNPLYVYEWFEKGQQEPFYTGEALRRTVLTDWNYRVKAKAANGCISDEAAVEVTVERLALTITASKTEAVFGEAVVFSVQGEGAEDLNEQYAWDFGDGATSSLKEPVHYYYVDGDMAVMVTVTSKAGCAYEQTLKTPMTVVEWGEDGKPIKEEIITAIQRDPANTKERTLKLWPNPVKGNLFVTIPKGEEKATYALYSIIGLVRRGVLEAEKVHGRHPVVAMGDLPAGLYFLFCQGNWYKVWKR